MSLFRVLGQPLRQQLRASATPVCVRRAALSTSAMRPAGKESQLHNENRAEEAEAKKQEQLKEQKEGRGQWKEDIASDSESAIKADRHENNHQHKSAKDDTAQLQKDTKNAPAEKHNQ